MGLRVRVPPRPARIIYLTFCLNSVLSLVKGGVMRKLFLVFFLLVIGCAKQPSPQQFVLEGTVRLDKKVKDGAKVKLEICEHTKWLEDKEWKVTTDGWGRYRIILSIDWFGDHYRVRASAYDKYGNFHLSEWQYGIVRYSTDKKDIWLAEKQVEEAKKKRRRRF